MASIVDGRVPWDAVVTQLAQAPARSPALRDLVTRRRSAPTAVDGPPAAAGASGAPGASGADDALQRARTKLRAVREQREEWRRRAEGAEARAARAEAELEALRAEVEDSIRDRERLRGELAAAADERGRAVAREGRRHEAVVARLREELRTARRVVEDERRAARRLEEQHAQERAAARGRHAEEERRTRQASARSTLAPGRPSLLPDGVGPGTTEAARLLLHAGRLVLVDGYNVTLQHRGELDLERQRAWLVGYASTLVAQRGIEPVVVFDGERAGGGRLGPARGVQVRFTAPGVTADDELVLDVEATDRPVVVVTDDRELAARVRASGADVVPTRAFLGVAT